MRAGGRKKDPGRGPFSTRAGLPACFTHAANGARRRRPTRRDLPAVLPLPFPERLDLTARLLAAGNELGGATNADDRRRVPPAPPRLTITGHRPVPTVDDRGSTPMIRRLPLPTGRRGGRGRGSHPVPRFAPRISIWIAIDRSIDLRDFAAARARSFFCTLRSNSFRDNLLSDRLSPPPHLPYFRVYANRVV